MNYLVSVIIPVYNVKAYFQECLTSVLKQSYTNLEIIIVDDGSTDGSSELCDEIAKLDNRIKVIHKSNGGLSSARNTGIEIASGNYLAFIDSDDFIDSLMIEKLLEEMKISNCDISCCNFDYCNEQSGFIKQHKTCIKGKAIYDSIRACENLLLEGYYLCFACNKLYKKNLFDDIRYPVNKINEDVITTYKIFKKASLVTFINESLYHYRIRSNSITRSKFSSNRYDLIRWLRIISNENKSNAKIQLGCAVYYLYFIDEMLIAYKWDEQVYREFLNCLAIAENTDNYYEELSSTRRWQLLLCSKALAMYKFLYIAKRALFR